MGAPQRVAVVGAGQMGAGIAQVAAQHGATVFLFDRDPASLERGTLAIEKSLNRLAKKGKVADPQAVFAGVRPVNDHASLASADLVIEAVTEDEALKIRVFKELDEVVQDEAVFASNTSSISITRLAKHTRRPHRFIGMHFMNPVPIMALVEIIPGLHTSEDTLRETRRWAERWGKTVIQSRDEPGFVVNRILMPMVNEAVFLLQDGVATAADIDAGMTLGTRHPMGPLALADLIGLDTCLAIMEVLHRGLGDGKYRPAPLLRRYVDAGWLGRKSKRGFYTYDD